MLKQFQCTHCNKTFDVDDYGSGDWAVIAICKDCIKKIWLPKEK